MYTASYCFFCARGFFLGTFSETGRTEDLGPGSGLSCMLCVWASTTTKLWKRQRVPTLKYHICSFYIYVLSFFPVGSKCDSDEADVAWLGRLHPQHPESLLWRQRRLRVLRHAPSQWKNPSQQRGCNCFWWASLSETFPEYFLLHCNNVCSRWWFTVIEMDLIFSSSLRWISADSNVLKLCVEVISSHSVVKLQLCF